MAKPFFRTKTWQRLRHLVIRRDRGRCTLCGRSVLGSGQAHVDHIVSRKKRPDLEHDPDNLRTLCHSCHSHKTWRRDGAFAGPDRGEATGCFESGDPAAPDHPWNSGGE